MSGSSLPLAYQPLRLTLPVIHTAFASNVEGGIPFGAIFTPCALDEDTLPTLYTPPIRCSKCKAILNAFCTPKV